MTRFDLDLPALRRRDALSTGGLALQQKCRAITHLRNRRKDAPVPHRRRDQVASCVQQRRQIEALVAPVAQIAARWSVTYPAAIHVENEPIVGAYAYRVIGGNSTEIERTPEVQYYGLAQWGSRMRDPGGVPVAVHRVGRCCRRGLRQILCLGGAEMSSTTTKDN
jgi:hypothetical protein